MIPLDNRLKIVFKLCRAGVVAADVGTDHAQLAAALALEKSSKVYASDIKDGPLNAAKRTLDRYGVKNAEVIKSDGLENIPCADDVIVCGMGGELIARIVEECRFINANTRFILQPMTKADYLRKRLCGAGFELMEEQAAENSGKIYTVMLWRYTGVKREIDEIEALCGKNRDGRYLGKIAKKLLKNAANMEKSAEFSEEAEHLKAQAEIILGMIKDEDK